MLEARQDDPLRLARFVDAHDDLFVKSREAERELAALVRVAADERCPPAGEALEAMRSWRTLSRAGTGSTVRGRSHVARTPNRVVFSWVFAGSDELPPGTSTVEVLLTKEASGTRVDIINSGLPERERAEHAKGWRHFLGRLAHQLS